MSLHKPWNTKIKIRRNLLFSLILSAVTLRSLKNISMYYFVHSRYIVQSLRPQKPMLYVFSVLYASVTSNKNSKENVDSYCLATFFYLYLWKMYLQKVISRKTKQKNFLKNLFLLVSWRLMTKMAGFRSGSISQSHGSADPDPHQNVMDPQHWCMPNEPTYSALGKD